MPTHEANELIGQINGAAQAGHEARERFSADLAKGFTHTTEGAAAEAIDAEGQRAAAKLLELSEVVVERAGGKIPKWWQPHRERYLAAMEHSKAQMDADIARMRADTERRYVPAPDARAAGKCQIAPCY